MKIKVLFSISCLKKFSLLTFLPKFLLLQYFKWFYNFYFSTWLIKILWVSSSLLQITSLSNEAPLARFSTLFQIYHPSPPLVSLNMWRYMWLESLPRPPKPPRLRNRPGTRPSRGNPGPGRGPLFTDAPNLIPALIKCLRTNARLIPPTNFDCIRENMNL